MGLMRSSLKREVQAQLHIREAALNSIGIHNDSFNSGLPGSYNTLIQPNSGNVIINGKNITLPPGAFHTNTVLKQCTVRLYSGVDVKPGTFKEYPLEKDRFKLAQQYFLEGGTKRMNTGFLSDHLNETDSLAQSFGDYSSAYGGEMSRSHPHRGFGIIPMPGITDVDVRTVSDFGSLRVAKINFECHSLNQLEILEMLYMRPGYPLLLEWAWTPFIDNSGKLINKVPYFDSFWDTNSVMWDMQKEAMQQKYTMSGNYDALMGFVKNFDWKSRNDGGFECTTELMGYGEIMEGLRGRNDLVPNKTHFKFSKDKLIAKPENLDAKYKIYGFDSVIPSWLFEGNGNEYTVSKMDNFLWILTSMMYYKDFNGFRNDHQVNKNPLSHVDLMFDENIEAFHGADNKTVNIFQKGVFKVIRLLMKLSGNKRSYTETVDFIDDYICKQGDEYISNSNTRRKVRVKDAEGNHQRDENGNYIWEWKGEGTAAGKSKFEHHKDTGVHSKIYFRWDFICEVLNHFVIDQAKGSSLDVEPLAKWDYLNRDKKGMIRMADSPRLANHHSGSILNPPTHTYVGLGEAYINNHSTLDIHKSFDPDLCLMPKQFFMTREEGKNEDRHYAPDYDAYWEDDSGHGHLPVKGVHYIKPMVEYYKNSDNENLTVSSDGLEGYFQYGDRDDLSIDEDGIPDIDDNAIGLTYINANFLIEKYKKHKYESSSDEPFSMLSFIQEIWTDISSKACNDYHQFVVHTEDDAATLRIIDLTLDPSQRPPSDTYQFKVQSNKSIVRDFKMKSAIPDSISAIIAASAQSPNKINAISTTLSAFANNIDSRFSGYAEDSDYDRTKSFDNLMARFIELQFSVYGYMQLIHQHKPHGWRSLSKKFKNQEKAGARELLEVMHQLNAVSARYVDIKVKDTKDHGNPGGPGIDSVGEQMYTNYTVPEFLEGDEIIHNTDLVPLEIELELDGISGVRIGDVIQIDDDSQGPRLPKGYNRGDIYFVVFGIKDKITSSQEWIQTLTCKMTIMGNKKNYFKAKFLSYPEGSEENITHEKELNEVQIIDPAVECNRWWKSMNGYPFSQYEFGWVSNPIHNYSDSLVEGLGNFKQYDPIGTCACKDTANRTGCRKHNGIDITTSGRKASICIKKGLTLPLDYNDYVSSVGDPTISSISSSDVIFPDLWTPIENQVYDCSDYTATHYEVSWDDSTYIMAGTEGEVKYRTGVTGYGGLMTLEGSISPIGKGVYDAGYYEYYDGNEIGTTDNISLYNNQLAIGGKDVTTAMNLKLIQQFGHVQAKIWKGSPTVIKGMVIGISGGASSHPNKGNSTGAHVHYETKLKGGRFAGGFVNPYLFTSDYNNGTNIAREIEEYNLETGQSNNCTKC